MMSEAVHHNLGMPDNMTERIILVQIHSHGTTGAFTV